MPRRLDRSENCRVVAERGYASPPDVEHVVDQGADILIRVNSRSLPL